jgi:hypothetical protein
MLNITVCVKESIELDPKNPDKRGKYNENVILVDRAIF